MNLRTVEVSAPRMGTVELTAVRLRTVEVTAVRLRTVEVTAEVTMELKNDNKITTGDPQHQAGSNGEEG